MRYIPFIDGLRAISVLAVIIFHFDENWLPGGFAGVDVFFVISGFVVTKSIVSNTKNDFVNFLLQFYKKRFLRILPALFFAIVLSSLAFCLFSVNGYLTSGVYETAKYAVFGLSNFKLLFLDKDYFGPTMDFNPFTHTWSLGVEEQFYLIYPLLFYFSFKYLNKKRTLHLFSIIFFISLGSAFYESRISKDLVFAFYSISTRFWELLAGCIGYLLYEKRQHIKKITPSFYSYIFLSALIFSFFFVQEDRVPYPEGILPVGMTIGFILSTLSSPMKNNFALLLLERPILVFLGKISYSLYLWHWPVQTMFRWTVGLDDFLKITSCSILTFTLSWISYEWVEKPTRNNMFLKNLKHYLFFGVFLVVGYLAYTSVNLLFKNQNDLALSTAINNRSQWFDHRSFANETKYGNACVDIKERGVDDHVVFEGVSCSNKNNSTLYVIGDSHAGAYASLLKTLVEDFGIKVILFRSPGCGLFNFGEAFDEESSCFYNYKRMRATIEENIKAGDLIFLATLKLERFSDVWVSFVQSRNSKFMKFKNDGQKRALEQLYTEFDFFIEKGIPVLLEAPKPIFYAPTYRCSDWFNKSNPICSLGLNIDRKYLEEYRKPVLNEMLKTIPKGYLIWDNFYNFCPGDTCDPYLGHPFPLFSDGDHLSPFGNKYIYDNFVEFLKKENLLKLK
ncbi:MAG: acyltransferase family protein [Bdellovibrionales bacterium]